MARLARVVAPGLPHHITQRGNRRQRTFFSDDDYRAYLDFMAVSCARGGVEVWAYCLMPNHVHLIAVPDSEDGLRRAIGEAHRRYSRRINDRMEWRGHLWQGRFASVPLDQRYLLAAARYVELNPVRAGLAADAEAYPWSSAAHHLSGRDDRLVRSGPLLDMVPEWRAFLHGGLKEEERKALRRHERSGRPLGSEEFVAGLETALGRVLRRGKPGPKPKHQRN